MPNFIFLFLHFVVKSNQMFSWKPSKSINFQSDVLPYFRCTLSKVIVSSLKSILHFKGLILSFSASSLASDSINLQSYIIGISGSK